MDLRKIILKLLCFLCAPCSAGNGPMPGDSALLSILNKGVNYLAVSQLSRQHSATAFTGEWPSFIHNTSFIPFLGRKGKSAYDSNVFNTLFIHNCLAEFYLDFSENHKVIPVLKLAQENFSYYRNDSSFNFWPLLDRPDHLKCRHANCKQRRAVNFKYHYGFINNYTNIYDDADDTSAGLLAYYYSRQMKDKTGDSGFALANLSAFYRRFENHRDVGKRKTNWYNKRLGFKYRTGAYLTWFGPDKKPSHFFSWFFPSHSKQNILYGRNEIDCVVNANILRALFITKDTNVAGLADSKAYLKKVIEKEVCFTCGVYYPTEFTFHYALSRAISSGLTGFDAYRIKLADEILSKQNKNGYWESQIENNDLQATLYAVNSLMLLRPETDPASLEAPMNYILANMISGGDMAYWNGGVFFSGGSAIRYNHVWRSEAYTTCLALEAIVNYIKIKSRA